jgi:chitinase
MRAVLALMVLLSCRADFQLQPGGRGSAPLADAGIGTVVRVSSPITLDGSRSVDPDGSITRYQWRLANAPGGSVATILDPGAPVTTFTPEVAGDFELELEVTDDAGNRDRSSVLYRVLLQPLTVDAGTDVNAEWRKRPQLAGQVLNAEGSETPVLTWSFTSKPASSTAVLENTSTLTPSFVADAVGTYVVQLVGTTSQHTSTDTMTVIVSATQIAFQGAFIDAVLDGNHDQLVAISDAPPRLRFISPATGAETSIALPSTPTALSMNESANYLAVATSGQVHIFDLFSKTLVGSHNVSFAISSLVFGPFGLVHCFMPQAGPIQTLDVMSGTITPTTFSISAGTVGRQYLNTFDMYTVDTTVTPADLTHYDSTSAPVERIRDSPYAGEHAMGGNLWIMLDLIFVRAGNVFQVDPFVANDMLYRTHLGGDEPATLEYAFGYLPKVLTLHARSGVTPASYQLRLYDGPSLALLESVPLPELVVNGVAQASTGRLIGYSPSYADKFVIVASAGSANAFIVTFP